MATTTLTQSPIFERLSRFAALYERLESEEFEAYDDLRDYAEANPEGYASLFIEVTALGHVLDDEQSAYGNVIDIRLAEEKKLGFVGVERIITIGLAPQVDLVLTCSSTSSRWYSAVLHDRSSLSSAWIKTNLSDEQVEIVLAHYDLDLSQID
jgi:hypothetical protein